MKPRVYVETSVMTHLSGRLSRDVMVLGDQLATRDWWRETSASFDLVSGPPVAEEYGFGVHQASRIRPLGFEPLTIIYTSDASHALAERLLEFDALPEEAAVHVSIAVANGVEYLATWDFRHIANPANASKIDQACRVAGYRPTTICTPRQLMEVRMSPGDEIPASDGDSVIADIRRYRDQQAARFGCDVAAINSHARTMDEACDDPGVQTPPRQLEEMPTLEQDGGVRPAEVLPSSRK